MSVNGVITAVRISRKSSLSRDFVDEDAENASDDEARRSRPPTGRQRQPRPKTAKSRERFNTEDKSSKQMLRADSDQIDLEKLLHSMLDINDNKKNGDLSTSRKGRPFSAHQLGSYNDRPASEVSNGSFQGHKPRARPFSAHVQQDQRGNYSFSNDRVKDIDRENQRLLRELVRKQGKVESRSKQPVFIKKAEPLKVKSSATLNRIRVQQQIERENLALLRRLEKVKPTRELSREHLLREHFRQEQLATNVSRSKRRPSSAGNVTMSRKSSSLNDLHNIDNASVASSKLSLPDRHRSGSLKQTTGKKHRTSSRHIVDNRPIWDSGW